MNPLDYLKIINKDPGESAVIVESCRDINPAMNHVAIYYDKDDSSDIENAILEPGTITAQHCCTLFKKKPVSALRVILKQHGKDYFTEYFIEKYGSVEAIFAYLNKNAIDKQSAYQNKKYEEDFNDVEILELKDVKVETRSNSKKDVGSFKHSEIEKDNECLSDSVKETSGDGKDFSNNNLLAQNECNKENEIQDIKVSSSEDTKNITENVIVEEEDNEKYKNKDINYEKNLNDHLNFIIDSISKSVNDFLLTTILEKINSEKIVDKIIEAVSEKFISILSAYEHSDLDLNSRRNGVTKDLNGIVENNTKIFNKHVTEIKQEISEQKDKILDVYLLLKDDDRIRKIISEELTAVLTEQLDVLKDNAIETKQLSLDVKENIKSLEEIMENYMEVHLKQNSVLENILELVNENSKNIISLSDQFRETFSDDSDF